MRIQLSNDGDDWNHWSGWHDVKRFIDTCGLYLSPEPADHYAPGEPSKDAFRRVGYLRYRLLDFPEPFQRYCNEMLVFEQTPPAERGPAPTHLAVLTQIEGASAGDHLQPATPAEYERQRDRWIKDADIFARYYCAAWKFLTMRIVAQLSCGTVEGRGILDGTPPGKFAVREPIPKEWWDRAELYANPSCAISRNQVVRDLELTFAEPCSEADLNLQFVRSSEIASPVGGTRRDVIDAALEIARTRPADLNPRHGRLTLLARRLKKDQRFANLEAETISDYIREPIGNEYGDRRTPRR
ncbi:MAG: hypothetical protein KBA31_00100 [Alphaproteobacteria bacterium]|nr:hypothetical protein [Alphaproteobacteria bacterium]